MKDIIRISEIQKSIEDHLSKAKFHQQSADELQKALDVIIKLSDGGQILIEAKQYQPKPDSLINDKKTFKEYIIDIFENYNRPLSGKFTYNELIKITEKHIEYNIFSGQFSTLVKKKVIGKYTFPNNPIESKFFYGLPKWFKKDGELRPEYLDKIKAVLNTA